MKGIVHTDDYECQKISLKLVNLWEHPLIAYVFQTIPFMCRIEFWACVSSSRYHSVRSDRDQLAIQLKENQITKDSFEVIAQDLETTKLQLQKQKMY